MTTKTLKAADALPASPKSPTPGTHTLHRSIATLLLMSAPSWSVMKHTMKNIHIVSVQRYNRLHLMSAFASMMHLHSIVLYKMIVNDILINAIAVATSSSLLVLDLGDGCRYTGNRLHIHMSRFIRLRRLCMPIIRAATTTTTAKTNGVTSASAPHTRNTSIVSVKDLSNQTQNTIVPLAESKYEFNKPKSQVGRRIIRYVIIVIIR